MVEPTANSLGHRFASPLRQANDSIDAHDHCGHPRTYSQTRFDQESGASAEETVAKELDRLLQSAHGDPNATPQDVKQLEQEMNSFYKLFKRFLRDSKPLDWASVGSPEGVKAYVDLPPPSPSLASSLLSRLAVVKLNGGLGTTMGCVGPKSAIEVRNGMTFLDLTVRQIEHLNELYGCSVPLLLMNSFNTDKETKKIIQKYGRHAISIKTFLQSRYPRIAKETLTPLANSWNDAHETWYPPGHGDFFAALRDSGLLDELVANGKEWLFISNVDNLGATVDLTILQHMSQSGADFCMEVTDKTKADIKGGTLISIKDPSSGSVHQQLLELAQVPTEHKHDFTSIKKFKIFNTNNIWISLSAVKQHLASHPDFDLDVIVNEKVISLGKDDESRRVLQLETAIGAAIKHFPEAHGINVPRSRFLPVKSCSDLFLVQSDLYSLEHGSLKLNPKRQFGAVPLVKLGDHFRRVPSFLDRLSSPPHILELDHLSVTGDVTFGKNVTLRGTVIIVANHGERIDIPSGAVLEDKVVSGCLTILDH